MLSSQQMMLSYLSLLWAPNNLSESEGCAGQENSGPHLISNSGLPLTS